MPSVPPPADPGWDEDPAWLDRDPMTAAEREAWLDRLCEQDDDPLDDPQEYWDPDSCAPPPGEDELTAGDLAGIGEAAADPGAGPASGTGPAGGAAGGFAGRVTLTVPLGTAAGLADRPGELAGLGPVDPWLARDLVTAAARNPKTTWCVTVTHRQGHAVGHGCARPEPKATPNAQGPARRQAGPGSPSPPPVGTARPADTAPGGCASPAAGRT
jgi:hypothetical protein